jgi:hypothetical protein
MRQRVTKTEWYRLGGFRNSRCFRRQRKDGRWLYYVAGD